MPAVTPRSLRMQLSGTASRLQEDLDRAVELRATKERALLQLGETLVSVLVLQCFDGMHNRVLRVVAGEDCAGFIACTTQEAR